MTFQHILFSIEDGVAFLSLNRPEQLNSFNTAMHLAVSYTHLTLPTNREV